MPFQVIKAAAAETTNNYYDGEKAEKSHELIYAHWIEFEMVMNWHE